MRTEEEAMLLLIKSTQRCIDSKIGELDLSSQTETGLMCRRLVSVMYALEDILLDTVMSSKNATMH